MSTTVMVCVHVAVLPHGSVAVQVLVITSVLPQFDTVVSENVFVTVPQPSVAVGKPVPVGEVSPPHSTVAFAGQIITGGVVSTTVIVWIQVAVLPH